MTLQEGCQTIHVAVNGETKTIPAGLSVRKLLRWLEIDAERVAVELDREIRLKLVRGRNWRSSSLWVGGSENSGIGEFS
jgi:hypothetical protein